MLRTLANYFLGENVQNEEPARMDDEEDDWVFVDDERTKSVLVIDNEANNSLHSENDENEEQEEPVEEDFSWENSLIEHPSVYIASHQQQHLQQLQREEKPTEEPEVADPRSGVSTRESARNTRASRNAPNLPQQQQHPRTNPHPRHLINHNSQPSSVDIVDALKQQQHQSKKKHCQRNAKVQQNVRNKPQRRSDKQTYTRFSRVNNDRKCC